MWVCFSCLFLMCGLCGILNQDSRTTIPVYCVWWFGAFGRLELALSSLVGFPVLEDLAFCFGWLLCFSLRFFSLDFRNILFLISLLCLDRQCLGDVPRWFFLFLFLMWWFRLWPLPQGSWGFEADEMGYDDVRAKWSVLFPFVSFHEYFLWSFSSLHQLDL